MSHEGIVYFDQSTGCEFVGREEFGKACYDLWTDAYPDNELRRPVLIAEGDLVCFQGRFVGTNTGVMRRPELDLPPTGKAIDAPFAFVAEVRDEKVRRVWHYYDRLLAFEQEGILTVEKLLDDKRERLVALSGPQWRRDLPLRRRAPARH